MRIVELGPDTCKEIRRCRSDGRGYLLLLAFADRNHQPAGTVPRHRVHMRINGKDTAICDTHLHGFVDFIIDPDSIPQLIGVIDEQGFQASGF